MLLLVIVLTSFNALAGPKTNINKITDLYDKNLDDKQAFFNKFHQENSNAVANIKSKKDLNLVEGMSGAESEASRLSSIDATSLSSEGRKARASKKYKFFDENELEPNYKKPGNRRHKRDADHIGKATDKLMSGLMGKLKDIGVDCKTVKGPIQKEPVYYIDPIRHPEQNRKSSREFLYKNSLSHHRTSVVAYGGFILIFRKLLLKREQANSFEPN
jgi:hypothetical protein